MGEGSGARGLPLPMQDRPRSLHCKEGELVGHRRPPLRPGCAPSWWAWPAPGLKVGFSIPKSSYAIFPGAKGKMYMLVDSRQLVAASYGWNSKLTRLEGGEENNLLDGFRTPCRSVKRHTNITLFFTNLNSCSTETSYWRWDNWDWFSSGRKRVGSTIV